MKNLARLTLFFSLSFILLFILSVLAGLLAYWIDLTRIIPTGAAEGVDAAGLAWKALPVAIYLSILLALSYSARRNIQSPLTLVCIFVLGCAFSAGSALGISRAEALKPALRPVSPLQGKPGLILTQSENAMILLQNSSDIRGPRVVSIPGQPLIYQEVPLGPNNTILKLPALSFGENTPWFIRSLDIDFSLSSGELKGRLGAGFFSFGVYAFSLILLLVSLRTLLKLSRWPLANLFIGALVFRLILALETFLNTREINALLGSFLSGRIPSRLISPLIFCALAVLFLIYTLLAHLAGNAAVPADTPGPGRAADD